MGLPVARLVVATNVNDILHRALPSGDYSAGSVTATATPSLDIQVSSNFELLLFDLSGRAGGSVDAVIAQFDSERAMTTPQVLCTVPRGLFTRLPHHGDAKRLA